MDCWHLRNKELFDSFREDIDRNYPTLIITIEENLVHIKGTLRIKDSKNVILGSFLVDIKIPHNFPQEIPEVREIGNKIPPIPDRHFEKDGKACLCFRDAVFLYWDDESTIVDFMKKFVEPFFVWQIEYVASDGQNKSKALLHGSDGAIQFYKRILHTDNIEAIYRFVNYLTKRKVKGHWDCFCGSGKKMRDCHFGLMKKHKGKIREKDAKRTIGDFNKIIKNIGNKITT